MPTPADQPADQELASAAMTLARAIKDCAHRAAPRSPGVRGFAYLVGLGKTAAATMLKVASATDTATVLANLPGPQALDRFREGVILRKIPIAALEQFDEARAAFEAVMAERNIDAPLRRTLGSRSADGAGVESAQVRARKKVFEGQCEMLGCAADAQVAATLVAPSARSGWCALAGMFMYVGLWRLHLGPDRAIYASMDSYGDAAPKQVVHRCLGDHPDFPMVITGLSTPPKLESELALVRGRIDTVSLKAPRTSAPSRLTVCFGEHSPTVGPEFADSEDDVAESTAPVLVPMRVAVHDLFLHRDLKRGGDPTTLISINKPVAGAPRSWPEREPVDIALQISRAVTGSLPSDIAEEGPRYAALLRMGAEALGYPLGEFEAFRVVFEYPLVRSRFGVSWALAQRSGRTKRAARGDRH